MDYYAGSGFSGKRYTVANLVIPSIGAVATTEVQVTLPGAKVGDAGFAVSTAAFTAGIAPMIPVRISATNTAQLAFCNASAAPNEPADTFDFDVYLFCATGPLTDAV